MGPLTGVRIVEFAGLGPGPMACMLLADMGASIVRIDRVGDQAADRDGTGFADPVMRGRDTVTLDLKQPDGVTAALELVAEADALIEGFRPGVMEALGLSPSVCLARNSRLVFARMTGWGQSGPLARTAGHDINYIALSGVLDRIGRAGQPPTVPLNLIGDYGGGALYLALGVVSAVLAARTTETGQVLDVAMVDGSVSLLAKQWGLLAASQVHSGRASNLLDGGAPFYDCYACADGRFVAVGAIEAKFYAALLDGIGLKAVDLPAQHDRDGWPQLRERIAARFRTRPRDEWATLFATTDACVTPVLAMTEVAGHEHIRARRTLTNLGGVPQPAPAPRFLGPSLREQPVSPPRPAGRTTTVAVLKAWAALADTRHTGDNAHAEP